MRSSITSSGMAASALGRSPASHAAHTGSNRGPRPTHSWKARYTGTFT